MQNENPALDAIGILGGQKSDIVGKKFEQVSCFSKFERYLWLFYIMNRESNSRISKPNEVIPVAVEFSVLVEPFQNKAFF